MEQSGCGPPTLITHATANNRRASSPTPGANRAKRDAMASGQKIPADVRAKFAEVFARTGNVSEAARAAKLPRSSCTILARELEANEEFVKARRSLLTHALERAEVMATQLLELTALRAKQKPRELPMGEGGFTIHDKSPDYVRAYTDLYRATQQHAKLKLDADPNRSKVGQVTVTFQVDGDPEPMTLDCGTA